MTERINEYESALPSGGWDPSSSSIDADGNESPSSPVHSIVSGVDSSMRFSAKTLAEFQIIAHDAAGRRKQTGGEAFFVAIRGASRIRARIIDNSDGTYTCKWHAGVSGSYSLVVSLFGERIQGCPIPIVVCDPTPHAPNCEVSGASLNSITARCVVPKEATTPPPSLPLHLRARASSPLLLPHSPHLLPVMLSSAHHPPPRLRLLIFLLRHHRTARRQPLRSATATAVATWSRRPTSTST